MSDREPYTPTVEEARVSWIRGAGTLGIPIAVQRAGEEFDRMIAAVRTEATEDAMFAFFRRFTATGSVSVPVIRKWWGEQLDAIRAKTGDDR